MYILYILDYHVCISYILHPLGPQGLPLALHAFGRHHLSNATCLIRPHLFSTAVLV